MDTERLIHASGLTENELRRHQHNWLSLRIEDLLGESVIPRGMTFEQYLVKIGKLSSIHLIPELPTSEIPEFEGLTDTDNLMDTTPNWDNPTES